MTKKIEDKIYIWLFDVDGESREWRCCVGEKECVFFEGETETGRQKIQEQKRKRGVLQIDSVVQIFGDEIPFQLENGIPYLKIDGRWKISHTTMEERIENHVRNTKIQCLGLVVLGLFLGGFSIWQYFTTGFNGLPLVPILAVLSIFISISMFANLRNEMDQIGREFTWKL